MPKYKVSGGPFFTFTLPGCTPPRQLRFWSTLSFCSARTCQYQQMQWFSTTAIKHCLQFALC